MFLLQIKNLRVNSFSLKHIENLKLYLRLIKQKRFALKKLKNKKTILFVNSNKFIEKQNLIFVKYIIGLAIFRKNTVLYVTDIKGKLFLVISAGSLGLKGNQKIKKPLVFLRLIQAFFKSELFNMVVKNPVALHLKNFNFNYINVVTTFLEKNGLLIASIKNFKNIPHNGCRPRKIKRKKRRKLFFK